MEKISIGKKKKLYEICSIINTSKNLLRIEFPKDKDIPKSWGGDIHLYTAGGIPCFKICGYETVYMQEGQTVYLSNDGSVYVPPAQLVPVPESEPLKPNEQGERGNE